MDTNQKLNSDTKHAILIVEAGKISAAFKDGKSGDAFMDKTLKNITELEFKTHVFKESEFKDAKQKAAELNKMSIQEPKKYQEILAAFHKDLSTSIKTYSSPKTLDAEGFAKTVKYFEKRGLEGKDVISSTKLAEKATLTKTSAVNNEIASTIIKASMKNER